MVGGPVGRCAGRLSAHGCRRLVGILRLPLCGASLRAPTESGIRRVGRTIEARRSPPRLVRGAMASPARVIPLWLGGRTAECRDLYHFRARHGLPARRVVLLSGNVRDQVYAGVPRPSGYLSLRDRKPEAARRKRDSAPDNYLRVIFYGGDEFEDKHWGAPHSASVRLPRGVDCRSDTKPYARQPALAIRRGGALGLPRVLLGAVVSQLHGLCERIVGRAVANLQVPDRLERRLGAAAQVYEAISPRTGDQGVLVRLLRAGGARASLLWHPVQAAADGGVSLDERAYRRSSNNRRDCPGECRRALRIRVWSRRPEPLPPVSTASTGCGHRRWRLRLRGTLRDPARVGAGPRATCNGSSRRKEIERGARGGTGGRQAGAGFRDDAAGIGRPADGAQPARRSPPDLPAGA